MTTKGAVPDAWDDDWVSKADKPTSAATPAKPAKLSKAEKRAQQAEFNRQLWEEAETPRTSYLWDTRNDIPLAADFKPTIKKVLSRKPKSATRTGIDGLTLEDDDDDDDENTTKPLTLEERQLKAQKEREEKQKKYQEARQRILGNSEATSGTRSPGYVTPPSRSGGGIDSRNRGRGDRARETRPTASADSSRTRQLFDPNYTAKPDSIPVQRREGQKIDSGPSTPLEEPIRAPRGPDGSGRGGFGFANRGR